MNLWTTSINGIANSDIKKFTIIIQIIIVLMILDDISGFIRAYKLKDITSTKRTIGLLKNLVITALLIIMVPLIAITDINLVPFLWYTYIGYSINELYSIAENLYQAGYTDDSKFISKIVSKLSGNAERNKNHGNDNN